MSRSRPTEGQLFGRLNQAMLLLNAVGVLLLAISAGVMWWRSRSARQTRQGCAADGAPPFSAALLGCLPAAILTILLPLFGLSLLLVLAIERVLLRQGLDGKSWVGTCARRGLSVARLHSAKSTSGWLALAWPIQWSQRGPVQVQAEPANGVGLAHVVGRGLRRPCQRPTIHFIGGVKRNAPG